MVVGRYSMRDCKPLGLSVQMTKVPFIYIIFQFEKFNLK
jgi:hypothetical protein